MNKGTIIQSLTMVEDLLKDIIAASKYLDGDVRRGNRYENVKGSIYRIKEDGKTIYHLLQRVAESDHQTAHIFNYEAVLKKMGEIPSRNFQKRLSKN